MGTLGGQGDKVIEIPGRLRTLNEQNNVLRTEVMRLEADNKQLEQNYRDKENEKLLLTKKEVLEMLNVRHTCSGNSED